MNRLKFALFILTFAMGSEAAISRGKSTDCRSMSSCSDCIQAKGCAWCSRVRNEALSTTPGISACYSTDEILNVCDQSLIENPKSSFRVIASRPMKNGNLGNSIQIRPQEISIRMKPGEEMTIDIEFKKAENYPVDLYYLMDFSSSMIKYKNNLSKLGNKLAETMKNLTSDFQLGFGTFVDKVTLPYTSTLPSHLMHPCPKCRSPYSFKNHMSLTKETNRFSMEVENAEMSGNIDTPEGMLDGLMQAVVCRNRLNWREKARHIIVVSTDAPFHLAGDGKLGGVVEPHDGLCHLNETGYYTHSLVFDYPSVSQINQKSLENNMNVIFAVVNKVRSDYQSLTGEIRGASLGFLDAGENIAELIEAQYKKISTTVRLLENSQGRVNISFSVRCSAEEKWKTSNECRDVKGGSTIHFKARISISDCSAREIRSQDVTIKPEGINDTLTIHLESICDCQCSSLQHAGSEPNSKYCSLSGDLVCGQCVCRDGHIGEKCECTGDENRIHAGEIDATNCITNQKTNEVCSGRGECRCGVCRCQERSSPKEEISGKYCECDNFSCERGKGLLCSGHGHCECGVCECDVGWSGRKCDCPMDEGQCKERAEDEVCSGKGTCTCGTCHCQNETDENRYSGKFCQNCMTCTEQCDLYDDCIECLTHKSGSLIESNCQNCSDKFHITLIENLEDLEKNKSGKSCVSADAKECTFRYVYDFDENDKVLVWAEKNTWCPKEVNLIAVVLGTIGGTVLIGLLVLIAWKVITDIHDRREFEKFERERHLARWGKGENPLFKTATTTYENPTYVQESSQTFLKLWQSCCCCCIFRVVTCLKISVKR